MNPDAFFYLGQAYEAVGERERAIDSYERVTDLTPSQAEIHKIARERLRELD